MVLGQVGTSNLLLQIHIFQISNLYSNLSQIPSLASLSGRRDPTLARNGWSTNEDLFAETDRRTSRSGRRLKRLRRIGGAWRGVVLVFI